MAGTPRPSPVPLSQALVPRAPRPPGPHRTGAPPIGTGSSCCFGRGGPVVYANTSRLHLREVALAAPRLHLREARAAMTAEAAPRSAMGAREAATEAEGEPASEAVTCPGHVQEVSETCPPGEPASEAARRAREAALESLRYLHTGAQRVVPPRPRVETAAR